MMTKYTLFTGCLIPSRYPHLEALARILLPEVGIQLTEDPAFSCCPDPIQVGGADRTTWLAVAARNLAVAEEQGTSIISLCNGCTNTLAVANDQLRRNEELREKVNSFLKDTGHSYQGTIEVKHFLQAIWDDIGLANLKSKVIMPLTVIKAATHGGCHLMSPHEVMQFDNPLDPTKFDKLVQALGAEAIEYNMPTECCGVSLALAGDQEASFQAVRDKLTNVHKNGANCLVVGCPFCFQQFDLVQVRTVKLFNLPFQVPIFYYLQLLGIALGHPLEKMELSAHKIRDRDLEDELSPIKSVIAI